MQLVIPSVALVLLVGVLLAALIVRGLAVLLSNSTTRSNGASALVVLGIILVGFFFIAEQRTVVVHDTSGAVAKSLDLDSTTAESRTEEPPAATEPLTGDKSRTHLKVRGQPDKPGVARPSWIDEREMPGVSSRRFVIHAGPEASAVTLERAANRKIEQKIDDYLTLKYGPQAPAAIRPTTDYVRSTLIQQVYTETQTKSVGGEEVPVSDQWFLIDLDDAAVKHFNVRWREMVASSRIRWLAAGFAGILLVCGTVYTYLKADIATDGQYRNRLRAAAAAFILILMGGAALLIA